MSQIDSKTSATSPPVSSGEQVPYFLREEFFPPLTWVVEDFVQEAQTKEQLKKYLLSYVENNNKSFLSKIFNSNFDVRTLFLPSGELQKLKDLSKIDFEQLNVEFKKEVEELRNTLVSSVVSRPYSETQKYTTARDLASAIQFLTRSLRGDGKNGEGWISPTRF